MFALYLVHSIYSISNHHLHLKMGFSVRTARLSNRYFPEKSGVIKSGKDHKTDQLANMLLWEHMN